jgi:hypothetical protein
MPESFEDGIARVSGEERASSEELSYLLDLLPGGSSFLYYPRESKALWRPE